LTPPPLAKRCVLNPPAHARGEKKNLLEPGSLDQPPAAASRRSFTLSAAPFALRAEGLTADRPISFLEVRSGFSVRCRRS
jgi:hypothetical protein